MLNNWLQNLSKIRILLVWCLFVLSLSTTAIAASNLTKLDFTINKNKLIVSYIAPVDDEFFDKFRDALRAGRGLLVKKEVILTTGNLRKEKIIGTVEQYVAYDFFSDLYITGEVGKNEVLTFNSDINLKNFLFNLNPRYLAKVNTIQFNNQYEVQVILSYYEDSKRDSWIDKLVGLTPWGSQSIEFKGSYNPNE